MRWLIFFCCLPSIMSAVQYQQITFTAPAKYTLSPTDAQLICTSLYGQLTTEALNKIERLMATPYSCGLSADQKSLIIKFTLKNNA